MGKVLQIEPIRTYQMAERAAYLDFDIRNQSGRPALTMPHRHEFYQVTFNISGDSKLQIGGASRDLRPGALSFILPFRVHVTPHPKGAEYVVINFTQRFLRPELTVDPLDLEEVPISQAPELAPFRFQEYVDFDLDGSDLVKAGEIVSAMLDENLSRRFGSMEYLRGLLLQLLALVCRRYEPELLRLSSAQAHRTSRRDALQRVTKYIRQNLTSDIALTDAAAAAFLSPNYLTHLLKKETGRTFTSLVTERRLERARELLTNSSMRISEVARQSGFADEAYFTRRFKQWDGVTPRAFRESTRASVLSGGRQL